MEREGRRDDIETLRRLTVESGVGLILMGDPMHMSGAASRQGDYTREFARELEYKTGSAGKVLGRTLDQPRSRAYAAGIWHRANERKPAIDRLSAVILLQSYLDSAEARRSEDSCCGCSPLPSVDRGDRSMWLFYRLNQPYQGFSEPVFIEFRARHFDTRYGR